MRSTKTVRVRFWAEVILALLGAVLTLLTTVDREWIEWLSGTDPDGGSGTLEVVVVAGCFAVSVGAGLLARREWLHTPQLA
jgi:hypothetical protein